MSHQITKVDLIPNGELSICNVSQFDNGRVLPFEILENKEAYNIPNDIRVELHCRKPDGNIVTLPSENITDNIVTFLSTTQLTACYGQNVCEIALYGPDDYLIGSGNFILDVEKSPTLGGINSTSEIHNLEEQIEEIAAEIIGEDYYNKSEVDGLLALKANAADVYTKSQVDSALALKANAADVYTKSETDTKLALKANAADVYTKSEVYNKSETYTQAEVDALIDNIFPTLTATGPIANFRTALTKPLVSVAVDAGATTVTACGVNFFQTTATSKSEAGVDWIVNADGSITVSGNATGYTSLVVGIAKVNNRMGVVTISGIGSSTNIAWDNIVLRDIDNNILLYIVSGGSLTPSYTVDLTSYPDADNISITLKRYSNDVVSGVIKPQIELGNEVTTYHAYNGQTVPVSDATTLVTQSGINNVYADVGDVTVQYKYMSI